MLREHPQGLRQIGVLVDLPRGRLDAVDVPDGDGVGVDLRAAAFGIVRRIRPQRPGQVPVIGNALRHREAVLRVVDRRLQILLQAEAAEALDDLVPAPSGARHRDAEDPAGHVGAVAPIDAVPLVPEIVVVLQGRARRRLPARVQRVKLLVLRDIDDGEEIAGDPDVHRLHQIQRRRGCDRGVNRVAALHEDAKSHLGRQRLARRPGDVARLRLHGCRDGCIDRIAAFHQDAESGLRRDRLAGGHHPVLRHRLGATLPQPSL